MTARKYAVQVINTDGTERDPVEFKSARAAHDCLMGELERSGSDVDSVRVMRSDDECPGQWVVIDRCDPRNAR